MNDILLTAKMLQFGANTPISITQSASTGAVTFTMGYSNQLTVTDGKLTIAAIDTSIVTGLDGKISVINNSLTTVGESLNAVAARVTTAEADIDAVQGNVTTISGRIDALEAGTVDLSDYTAPNGIKMTASGANGISFVTKDTTATVTINNNAIVTVDKLSAYQTIAEKNAANGYAGLDAAGKLTTEKIPLDLDTLTVTTSGAVAVNPQRVAVLNEHNKIDRSYLDSIDIQEVYSATLVNNSFVFTDDGIELDDIELGDAVILTADSDDGAYQKGQMFYRTSKDATGGSFEDFAPIVRDILSATTEQINQGDTNEYYITPAALKNSAPTIDGANITNITGSAVSRASTGAYGVVKVDSGNGLSIGTDGVVKMSPATADTAGAVIPGNGFGTIGTDGSFDVAVTTDTQTLSGDGGATALKVKLDPAGAITATEDGIKLNIDTALLTITDSNKLTVATGALATYRKKQVNIPITDANYNSATGVISFYAYEYPKGIRKTTSSSAIVAIIPGIGSEDSDGRTSYTFDVTGFDALNEGTWEIVF